MNINSDFSARAAMHANAMEWQASPMDGVDRKMLDRIGDEVARATTIVRYAPGSHFSAHTHTGGEEFIVLDGVFQDEHGDYPAGSYVRNPPTSSHTPRSDTGCTIFVKLWQFDRNDRTFVRTPMNRLQLQQSISRPGVRCTSLYYDPAERVRIEEWSAGKTVTLDAHGGAEILVLDGSFAETGETFQRYSWLRVPDGYKLSAEVGQMGAKVWVKTGHLETITIP